MSSNPGDYRIEILRGRPQGLTTSALGEPPAPEPVDVTAHAELDGLSAVNRALERDLLTFKTGDVTVTFDNPDRYFDDLFDPALFTQATIWSLRILRRGEVQFWGVLIGKGSVKFKVKDRQCEVTAYGLTKLLDMTSTDAVKRTFSAMTFTGAVPGVITLNTTASLLTGDVLHITDHSHSEDFTVRRVLSGTTLEPEAPLVNTYAVGATVTCTTPFPRFKTIGSLVDALFTASGVPLADLRLSNSQFDRAAPTPVNLEGISLANNPRRGMTTYTGRWHVDIAAVDGYSQVSPDSAWVVQGFPDQGMYDWTPFYAQGVAEPGFGIFEPVVGTTQEAGLGPRYATYWGAVDYLSATKRIWGLGIGTIPSGFKQNTTADGITYGGTTNVALPADDDVSHAEAGLEYDPVRNIVHVAWAARTSTNRHFRYRDLGGGAWVDCKQADDDADTGYFGPRYIADLDLTLVLRQDGGGAGPNFDICAFRGATRLWKRTFPGCRIAQDVPDNPYFYPTRTARYINGIIYMTLISDGAVQLVWSDDQFQTYRMKKIVDGSTNTILMATRVGDTYRLYCSKGTVPRYFICAPLYAGVIDYADFANISCAEGVKKAAIIADALFWVDDDLSGHFVARDLYDAGAVTDIADRVMEETDDALWDEIAQFVRVSGNGAEATSGDAGFAADGIELESAFIPNEAFAQALADAMRDFYSAQRRMVEATVIDSDGRIYRPLDRVTLGGAERYLVYESDHDLAGDEVKLSLLEDR